MKLGMLTVMINCFRTGLLLMAALMGKTGIPIKAQTSACACMNKELENVESYSHVYIQYMHIIY